MVDTRCWWYSISRFPSSFSTEVVELYAKAFSEHYRPAPYFGYSGRPGPVEAPARRDILVIGDSTVATTDLCDRLADVCSRNGFVQHFNNLGTVGANSGQALSRVLHEAVDAHPKGIIVIGGGIDVLTPLSFDPRPGFPHVHLLFEIFFESFFNPESTSVWLGQKRLSSAQLREAFFLRLSELRSIVRYMSPEWQSSVRKKLVDNVQKIARVCLAFETPLLYVLQPLAVFKRHLSAAEADKTPTGESASYISRQFEAASAELSASPGWSSGKAEFADLHALFHYEEADVFSDLIHCNARGREAIAQVIVERLMTAGWVLAV